MTSRRTQNMFNLMGIAPPGLRQGKNNNNSENYSDVEFKLQNNNVAHWLANQYDETVTRSPSPNHWSCEKENRPIVDDVYKNAESLNPVSSNNCLQSSSINLTPPSLSAPAQSFNTNPLQEVRNESNVIDESYENDVIAQTSTQRSYSCIASPMVIESDTKRGKCVASDADVGCNIVRSSQPSKNSSNSRPCRKSTSIDNYKISPINSDESDVDLSDNDPTYDAKEDLNAGKHRLSRLISNLSNSSKCKDPLGLTTQPNKNSSTSNKSPANSSSSDSSSSSTSSSSCSSSSSSSRSSSSSSISTPRPPNNNTGNMEGNSSITNSKKRKRNTSKWKQTAAKIARNSGQAYTSTSKTKRQIQTRCMKTPCSQKCRLKCWEIINEEQRSILFKKFWELKDINLQRSYINSSMAEITTKYRYTNALNPRKNNHAFYFIANNKKQRVCKTFFLHTLDITDRMIRTVISKRDSEGFIQADLRGKHSQHIKIDTTVIQDMKDHIDSIPRIEAHYLRAQTSREYIDGSRTVTEIYKDYVENQKRNNKPYGKFNKFYEVFTTQFNIGFFKPKKDQCDLCFQYSLSSQASKQDIKEKYDTHLKQKVLSREEMQKDRDNVSENSVCAVFDLQAVMQCPMGDTSAFYYKSRLNSFNFTIVELEKSKEGINDSKYCAYKNVHCYFWDETHGKRGSNEIGSCIFDYLKSIDARSAGRKVDVIFYSDNCGGQNKNKFVATLCSFAVVYFENIKSITHKFLIQGHTQNLGDNVHSLIEKEVKKSLKSGPIYVPYQYVTLIRSAKKHGTSFVVHELDYNYFFDIKNLQEQWGYNYTENEDKETFSWNDVKMLKFVKDELFLVYYKTSYKEHFKIFNLRNKRKKMRAFDEIELQKAYSERIELSANKKKDISDLLKKKLIPNVYAAYYNSFI